MQKKVSGLVKKAVYSILGAGFVFAFCSCQDPIFYHINQEVKLEEASIFGDVYRITRHTSSSGEERLYFANGYIYYKAVDADGYGKWKKCSRPSGHVVSVVSDSSALYALVFTSDRNDIRGEMEITGKRIYKSTDDGATWTIHPETAVAEAMTSCGKGNSVSLMCTNSLASGNRKAYANIRGTIYNLTSGATVDHGTTVGSTTSNTRSCADAGSDVKFFNCYGACASKDSGGKIFASSGAEIYVYNSSGTFIEKFMTSVGVIYGIAVFDNGNEVLITSSSGSALYRKTGSSWNEVEYANLTSTVSSLYEGYYAIAADPSKSALETAAYAAIAVEGNGSNSAQFTHEGLWAYYPARGKWNIE